VRVADGARLDASAGISGNGGEVILFAEDTLSFYGFASARGGDSSGDGGFVELSGKRRVDFAGFMRSADVGATNGRGGRLLFDPIDVTISTDPGGPIAGSPTNNQTQLNSTDISNFLQNSGSLEIRTDGGVGGAGDITIADNTTITWNSASDFLLTPDADFTLGDNASIVASGAGGISVITRDADTPTGSIFLNAGSRIETTSGDIVLRNQRGSSTGVLVVSATVASDSGQISLEGTGGTGAFEASRGVILGNGSVVRTNSSDIFITGTGGGTPLNTTAARGVVLNNSQISAGGNVTITGTGGISPNGSNGIRMVSSMITSSGGTVVFDGAANGANAIQSGRTEAGTIVFRTRGGDVRHDGILAADRVVLENAATVGSPSFSIQGRDSETIGTLETGSTIGDLTVSRIESIGLGKIQSTGDISITTSNIFFLDSGGNSGSVDRDGITVSGMIRAGNIDLRTSDFVSTGRIDADDDFTLRSNSGGLDARIDAPISAGGMVTIAGGFSGTGTGRSQDNVIDIGAKISGTSTVAGSSQDDLFIFRNQANVDLVDGRGGDGDRLVIDDTNLGGTNSYTIGEGFVSRNPRYEFISIENLELRLGPGDDTVFTQPTSFSQNLDGGAGFDTLITNPPRTLQGSPLVLGGTTISYSNFEAPLPPGSPGQDTPVPAPPDPGILQTMQTMNDQPVENRPDNGGQIENNFNRPNGPVILLQTGGVPATPGTFGIGTTTAVVNILQGVVLLLDADIPPLRSPASLDGTGLIPTLGTITTLRQNLLPEANRELAEALEYGGPSTLIEGDGGYAVDLSGGVPAGLVAILENSLLVGAAQELSTALGLPPGVPLSPIDGPSAINGQAGLPGPGTAAALLENLDAPALGEISAALDGN